MSLYGWAFWAAVVVCALVIGQCLRLWIQDRLMRRSFSREVELRVRPSELDAVAARIEAVARLQERLQQLDDEAFFGMLVQQQRTAREVARHEQR